MRKIYGKLTADQKAREVVFSSCLSKNTGEMEGDLVHEVFKNDEDKEETIKRLRDDKFFNGTDYKYNIIRRGE